MSYAEKLLKDLGKKDKSKSSNGKKLNKESPWDMGMAVTADGASRSLLVQGELSSQVCKILQ